MSTQRNYPKPHPASASSSADQDNNAHLIRTGYSRTADSVGRSYMAAISDAEGDTPSMMPSNVVANRRISTAVFPTTASDNIEAVD